MKTKSLQGRVALVTGSTRGLGRHLALALAGQGADVFIHGRRSSPAAEQAVAEARALGARSRLVTGDVRQWHQVRELMSTVAAEYGRLDILINNVGDFLFKPLLRLTVEEWRDMIDSNLHSAFYGCKAALPTMVQQGWGRIINVGVANADRIHAYAGAAAYAIAKSGVQILTRSLAVEVAAQGVTVNLVSPGLMESSALTDEVRTRQIHAVPMKRLGLATDLTSAVLYLLSDEAEYITGADITVSGGWGL